MRRAPEKAGAAAATGQPAYDLGLALGIAVTGSVAVAVYRAGIPADAPPQARDTLGAALAAAERLPNGTELITVAREGFTSGLQVAATVNAGFALVIAALVMTLLRHIPPISTAAPEEDRAPRGDDHLPDQEPTLNR